MNSLRHWQMEFKDRGNVNLASIMINQILNTLDVLDMGLSQYHYQSPQNNANINILRNA